MQRLILILAFIAGYSYADAKQEAVDALLTSYSAKDGDVDSLLELRYAVNDAILTAALAGMESTGQPALGSGDTVIYEFSDYQCGFCRRMFPAVAQAADDGKVKIVLIEFPILGALSEQAARYALVAHQQGRFEEFHRTLMSRGGRLREEQITAAAAQLEQTTLEEHLHSPAVDKQLEENYKLALLLGINGTPAFVINGQIYKGAIKNDDFRRLLEAL